MMKGLVMPAVLILTVSSLAHAACPPEIPAKDRVRIVECMDNTYAVEYRPRSPEGWRIDLGCGHELEEARQRKKSVIRYEEAGDAEFCGQPMLPIPKTPRVIVE